jgi:hypothetical protein
VVEIRGGELAEKVPMGAMEFYTVKWVVQGYAQVQVDRKTLRPWGAPLFEQ